MQELVSIIVPVYNAEKYLSKCLDSLINQTYKNIEIILINDGSKDCSLNICQDYAKLDNRIKVLDIPNGGVSSARNIGIQNASGEYIQFVDSDDFLELNMAERLVKSLESNNADLVVCGYNTCCKDKTTKNYSKIRYKNKSINSKDIDVFELFNTSFFNSPWNKLYKKSLISNYFRKDFKIGEDLLFNLDYLEHVVNFNVLDECLYNYIINSTSATNCISSDKLFMQIELYSITSKWFDNKFHNNDINKYQNNLFACNMLNLYIGYSASNDKLSALKKNTKSFVNNKLVTSVIKDYNPINFEHKILRKMFLFKFSFVMMIYGKLRKNIKQLVYK